MLSNLFQAYDENREIGTSCDDKNYQKKVQQWKKQGKILDGLTKWLNVGQVADALNVTRGQDAWKIMIDYPKKQNI